jgi:hypothetical protein
MFILLKTGMQDSLTQLGYGSQKIAREFNLAPSKIGICITFGQ